MNPELKKALDKIQTEYTEGVNKLMGLVKAQQEQIDSIGGSRSGTSEAIEKIEGQFKSLEEGLEEIKSKQDQIDAERGRNFMPGAEASKSLGAKFVESEEYKSYSERKFRGESAPMELRSLFEEKALTTDRGTGYGQLGNWIVRQELPQLDPIQQALTIRDLMPVIQTTSDTVHYIEYLGFANILTGLSAALLTTATVVPVDSTAGMFAGQKITIEEPNGTPKVEATILTVDSTTQITLTAAVGTAFTADATVSSKAIGMTAHGQQKPEAGMKITERSHPIGTMAHYMVAHRQTLQDIPQLRGLIDNELLFGLKQSEEEQILYGNGVSPNLQGIMNNTNIQNHGPFTGTRDTGGVWRYDHFRGAITKTQISGFPPSAAVVHPNRWAEIETAKDSQNRYVYTVFSNGATEVLWRVPVVVTMAIREQDFLLGAFNLGAYLLDREDGNVRFSDSHKDFFTSNQVAILAEERLGMAVRRPQAFVKGSWA